MGGSFKRGMEGVILPVHHFVASEGRLRNMSMFFLCSSDYSFFLLILLLYKGSPLGGACGSKWRDVDYRYFVFMFMATTVHMTFFCFEPWPLETWSVQTRSSIAGCMAISHRLLSTE